MKKKYYPESYKDSEIPFPHESGRKWKKGIQAQRESDIIIDENGEIVYNDHNNKEEIKYQTVYDWEKELLEAINSDKDDDQIPDRVQHAEQYNEIKERLDQEENKKYKKYDKYANYKVEENFDENIDDDDDTDTDINENKDVTDNFDLSSSEDKIDEKKENDKEESENQNLYYQRKITKKKSDDALDVNHKQNNYYSNKHPDKDRRHGKTKLGDYRRSNRAERQYTKRELGEILK